MYQRAGVKLHHRGVPNTPPEGFLLHDKQDEKRIASSANVPEMLSVASPSVLPLPQSIVRPAPAPLLNPNNQCLLMLALWSCGRRAGVVQAQRQIHRAFAGRLAPPLTHFVKRVMLICLIHWPRRGKLAGTDQMRQ